MEALRRLIGQLLNSRSFRRPAAVGLGLLLAGFAAGRRAAAVDYTWTSATTGSWSTTSNWTPSGNPNLVGDTATISATGAPYTVTVNAARTIGALTLNSADATLNASSILTSTATPTLAAGAIQGTVYFSIAASPLNVDLTNVTFPAAATVRLQRETGGAKSSTLTLPATTPANLTLNLRQTDGPYDRGALNVTTPNGFTNDGTMTLSNTGAYGSTLTYGITSGTLTNGNLITMSTVGSPFPGNELGVITFQAPIINEATGEIRLDRGPSGSTADDGRIVVGRSTSSHINRGLIRVDGGDGIAFVGTTLTNEGGTIRNNGVTTTLRDRSGSATIDNAEGTIEARGSGTASTFTIRNALSSGTRSGSRLVAGTYLVTGGAASTTLSLSTFGGAGTITALGDASTIFPATVTFNGTTAAFSQLESTSGSLATINASGRLNILGGKVFRSATNLSNAGTINVGSGSRLQLGEAGTGTLTVGFGGALVGSGAVAGNLTGDGLIAPGNSPGILTAEGQITPTSSTAFAFEFTGTGSPAWSNAAASVNDVLRLTNADPFTSGLTSGNEVGVYFDVSNLAQGDVFLGGFFSDRTSGQLNLLAEIGAPTYAYYVYGDGQGTAAEHNGKSYYTFAEYTQFVPSLTGVAVSVTTVPTANFSGGDVTNGQVTRFEVVPEPATLALVGAGIAAGAYAIRRRRQV